MALNEGHVGTAKEGEDRDPRIERLYRDAAREEPPAHLDAAILGAARREVGAGPRSLGSRLRRWHVPISIAAVVMVSVSLVVLVQEEESKRDRAPAIPTIPAPADQPAAPTAPPTQPEAAKDTMQRRLAATRSAQRASREETETAARSELAPGSPPTSPAVSGAGAVATPAGKPAPQPFLAAPSAVDEMRAARPEGDSAAAGRMASAPAAPAEPQAARSPADAVRAAPLAGAIAMKSAEQVRPPVWQGFEKEPPEKWLARIEELKAQGRGPEAQEMLSEFSRRFPEHPLPPGLK